MKQIFLLCFVLIFTNSLLGQAYFSTSLHGTRAGKDYWYGKANGGFENLTNIPIEDLGCKNCHGPTDAAGNAYDENNPYPGPGCADCHPNGNPAESPDVNQCYGCHGRQKTEAMKLGLPDVHRDAGMVCWDCHSKDDMHGDSDGTVYASMLENGAIDAECEDCHYEGGEAPYPDHRAYDPHDGKLHCTACHARTVISCYNCHFESMAEAHIKRAYKPINDFVLLVNREKDGKVYPASFQSLSYGDTTFVAFGPFTPHSIMKEGRTCSDCHNNETVKEYASTGEIRFATWNAADSTLSWKHGVVPIPPDYETSFKMDFITYTGAVTDPAGPSKKWKALGKETWDGHQMFFATPLTADQMAWLENDLPANFETSLHGTRNGKDYWYGKKNGGFENFTDTPIEELGCKNCHGPTDADGNAYDENNPYPGAWCGDCHQSDETHTVTVDQCYSCHGRQKSEMALGISDVHRDAGMVCWDCHGPEDMHGDGNVYVSLSEPGAIHKDCEDCHTDLPAEHANNDPHGGKLHCTACHTQTVLSCYNCHFESMKEAHVKRAKQKITGFVILVNREKDGKVGTASFQSLTYNGHAFVAFGPYTAHTITKTNARRCTDCHENFGGSVAAIEEYNTTGEIKFATWNEADSTLNWLQGVVPFPEDYTRSFKMDFITYKGDPHDPAGPSKNWAKIGKDKWDGHQLFFATPLTKEQLAKLGVDTTLTAVNEKEETLPTGFALEQNYPNPFNPTTNIAFKLPRATMVTLKVYNILGEEVLTLLQNARMSPGVHKVVLDGENLASGIYFYQLQTPEFVQSRKMVLMR